MKRTNVVSVNYITWVVRNFYVYYFVLFVVISLAVCSCYYSFCVKVITLYWSSRSIGSFTETFHINGHMNMKLRVQFFQISYHMCIRLQWLLMR